MVLVAEAVEFPDDAFAGAVAAEVNQFVPLFAVETLDRVVQASFWIDLVGQWQWVVYPRWPALFLEDGQNRLLIQSLTFGLLDYLFANPQLVSLAVPTWFDR